MSNPRRDVAPRELTTPAPPPGLGRLLERREVVLVDAAGQARFPLMGGEVIESIGPYVAIAASGPIVMLHEATSPAGAGIGHHPHRLNERLFYVLRGGLRHDDAMNGIKADLMEGTNLLTEGRFGMVHAEHAVADTHVVVLVYPTEPTPPRAEVRSTPMALLPVRRADGVAIRAVAGGDAPLAPRGDVRAVTDVTLDAGASLGLSLEEGEGAALLVLAGTVTLDTTVASRSAAVLVPPAAAGWAGRLRADADARVLIVRHGPGHGLARRAGSRPNG